MTVSPIQFGWVYAINGNTTERKQARTDIAAYAAKQKIDTEVLADVDDESDLYFTNDTNGGADADIFRQHQAEVKRYFALRRFTLDTQGNILKGLVSQSIGLGFSPADRKAYEEAIRVLTTDASTNHLKILAQMYGFSKIDLRAERARSVSFSVDAGTFNAEYGYA